MNRPVTIAVLGGSTPFTAGLFQALKDAAKDLPSVVLRLHGRNLKNLSAIRELCVHLLAPLGHTVECSTKVGACLDGADIIVHQVRYGDLEGRENDEDLCQEFGLLADETFGLGGLNAAIRVGRMIDPVAQAIRRHAPLAWIINLTNPLGPSTELLTRAVGHGRCVGVCELPELTARAVARLLDAPYSKLNWAYSGLNHRGFLHDLTVEGQDVFGDLLQAFPESGTLGIEKAWLEELGAVPLKYHSLLTNGSPVSAPGRARQLMSLKRRLLEELENRPHAIPDSLSERAMPWYALGVVPMIRALCSDAPREIVATMHSQYGICRERKALLATDLAAPVVSSCAPPPAKVEAILGPLIRLEVSVNKAAVSPSPETIAEALHRDPLIPEYLEARCQHELERRWLAPI